MAARHCHLLQVQQNRGARVVIGRPPWTSAHDLLERFSLHRVTEVYKQKLAFLVWYSRPPPVPNRIARTRKTRYIDAVRAVVRVGPKPKAVGKPDVNFKPGSH